MIESTLFYSCRAPELGRLEDLKAGGQWFNPWLSQYSVRGLMIVIATRSFLSHHWPLFRQWFCGKAASGLERILSRVLVIKTPGKHGWIHWPP